MPTLSRLTFVFGAPALLMAAVTLAAWLALGSTHNDFGPMRLAPLPTPTRAAGDGDGGGNAPPPNQIERISPAEAELKNALLPFTRSGLGAAAAYRPNPDAAAGAIECLTEAVYYEAAREPDVGQRAVAQVVLNRVASTPFPKTICGVVQQGAGRPGCQFTFMCDGSLARTPDPALWGRARSVAQAALNGYVEPSVGDATHYHADYVFPTWAPEMVKLVQIGRHIFYHWRSASLVSTIPAPEAALPDETAIEVTPIPLEPSGTMLQPSGATASPAPTPADTPTRPEESATNPPPLIDNTPRAASLNGSFAETPRASSSRRAMPERSLVSGQP